MIYNYIEETRDGYKMGIGSIEEPLDKYISIKPLIESKRESYRFLKGIEILISQGVDIYTAVGVLRNSDEYKKERATLDKIYKKMSEGQSFYMALKLSTRLPAYYLNLIKVAELSDDLLEPMREANRILERGKSVKRKVFNAVSYPAFLFFLSLLMLIVMSNFILPMFASLYEGFDADLPKVTKVAIGIGNALSNNLIYVLVIIFIIYIGLGFLYMVSYDFYMLVETYKYKYSLFRKLRQDYFLEAFFKKFNILYSRLENTYACLNHISSSEENLFLRLNLIKLTNEVQAGKDFVSIGADSYVFTEFSTALFTGVMTSQAMKEVSANLADLYKESVDSRLENLAKWISPIITLIVGVIIGIMAIGIVAPMFNLANII